MLKSFKLLLCCCALLMCGNMALAQNTPRNCGSMDYLEEQIRQDPKRLQKMQTIEDFTTRYASQRSGTALVTIPVVVHVVYNTTAENISVAQIQSQIDVLNKDFRRLNADANNTWPQAADVQVEFCLATIDPSGNSTTGITRTATSKTSFGTNDQVKYNSLGGKDAWPSGSYLNLWVCDISNGILGYAQFPGGAAATDGVVIDYQYFGTTGTATAPFHLGRTATHEVGHWLNLRHIWGDGGCSVDDNVSDTPLSDAANYGCAVGHVSCSTVDMVQNYMDYSDDACMNLFTAGQKTRMQALFAPGGFRYSLLSSQGCGGTPPTCTDGVQNGQETGVDCGGPICPACVCTANVVTITIKLDNYPEETSWTLSNAQGTVAAGGTYGSLADGATVAVPLCLANGCYNFTISDAYGDGICCNYGQGSYSVTDASGTVLVSGSSFGASETKSFCLSDSPAATCTDGIQNQGETGVDCGGPCTACVSCTDGIQNQGETGVDCGGPCSACATCTDGIQNQGETAVDCGGPCAPCACVYTTINFNNFDSGLGIWTDGGTDCALVSSATYANSGTNSVQLRDNTTTSVMTTSNLNLGGYTEVKIAFSYICVSMDKSNEDFWLQVSTNGGSTYTTVASWNLNDEFVNNVRYNPSVTLTGTFTTTTRFRFRCDASADDDLVYIDDVSITGCSLAGGRTESAVDIDDLVAEEPQLSNLELYPNPTNSLLNVKFSSNAETTASLRVMDMSGKVWQEQTINGTNGVQEQVLDISPMAPGVYFISIDSAKGRLIQRFVVVE